MKTAEIAGVLSGVISLTAYVPYIAAIVRRESRPNRATWIIWTVTSAVLLGSYYCSGARNTLWVPVSYFLGASATMVLSIFYGEGKLGKGDMVCLFVAAASLLLWWVTDAPVVAVLIMLGIDVIGGIPTARQLLRDSKSEKKLPWLLWGFGILSSLAAIESWRFEIWIYPVVMTGLIWTIVTLLLFPRDTVTERH